MKKLLILAFVLMLAFPLMAEGAKESEDAYPSRNVRVIIPWSVGGMTDVLTRPIAKHLEEQFGVCFRCREQARWRWSRRISRS